MRITLLEFNIGFAAGGVDYGEALVNVDLQRSEAVVCREAYIVSNMSSTSW